MCEFPGHFLLWKALSESEMAADLECLALERRKALWPTPKPKTGWPEPFPALAFLTKWGNSLIIPASPLVSEMQ